MQHTPTLDSFVAFSKTARFPRPPTLSGLAVERTLQLAGEVRHGLRDPFPFPFLSSLALEQFVGQIERRQDGDLARIEGGHLVGDLPHGAVYRLRQLLEV